MSNEKNRGILKNNILGKFCATIFTILVTSLPFLTFGIAKNHGDNLAESSSSQMRLVLENEGYNEFNQTYIRQQYSEIVKSYTAGEIDSPTLIDELEGVSSFDKKEFVLQYATAEGKAQYLEAEQDLDTARKYQNAFNSATITGATAFALGGYAALGAALADAKKKENAEISPNGASAENSPLEKK